MGVRGACCMYVQMLDELSTQLNALEVTEGELTKQALLSGPVSTN